MGKKKALFFLFVFLVIICVLSGCTQILLAYKVSYFANGATGGCVPASQTKIHNKSLVLQSNVGNLSKYGYTFAGWNTAADGSGIFYSTGASYYENFDLSLFANWTANTYSIAYDGNGNSSGSVPENQLKTHDVDITLRMNIGNLTKDNYKFYGWNSKADGSGITYITGGNYSLNGDATLYAKWIPDTYAVSYHSNDATEGSAPSDQTKAYGVTLRLLARPNIYKEYCEFEGWNTAADGSGTFYLAGAEYKENSPLTLYAQWDMIYSNSLYKMANYPCNLEIPYGFTSIDAEAFSNEFSLKSIIIPDSVKRIGEKAFFNCTGLTEITIPSGVTSIDQLAFYNCSNLERITFQGSNSITIGNNVFFKCGNLKNVIIQDISSWCSLVFNGEGSFPSSSSGTCNLIQNGELLTEIIIPSDKIIGNNSFAYCRNLTSVEISPGVTIIGDMAFTGCVGLSSVTIPPGVTNIGDAAFAHCIGLSSVTIPSSVESIGCRAFESCLNLTSIIIPYGVKKIKDSAFRTCNNLTSVTIPSSVFSIGNDAFSSCIKLTSLTIPHGVYTIGENAFIGCSALTFVSIPASICSIGANAFAWCTRLYQISFSGTKAQ